MKKKLIKIAILFSIISVFNIIIISPSYAWVSIIVTEKVPGASCAKIDSAWKPWVAKDTEVQMYKCNVAEWFTSVTEMLWKMIKYFTYIAALWWVLYIIINGIMYSMWWIEQSMKDESKKRITWTLVWLVLLFLSWIILNIIAPWIYK